MGCILCRGWLRRHGHRPCRVAGDSRSRGAGCPRLRRGASREVNRPCIIDAYTGPEAFIAAIADPGVPCLDIIDRNASALGNIFIKLYWEVLSVAGCREVLLE